VWRLRWQSKFSQHTADSLGKVADLIQRDVFLADVMARYQITKALSTQLNVDNFFNKEYYSTIVNNTQVVYGDPRTITLIMKYTF